MEKKKFQTTNQFCLTLDPSNIFQSNGHPLGPPTLPGERAGVALRPVLARTPPFLLGKGCKIRETFTHNINLLIDSPFSVIHFGVPLLVANQHLVGINISITMP